MKLKATFTLLALLISVMANAAGKITGKVTSATDGEPIDFASVQLINPTTGTPLQLGTATALDGTFAITAVPGGTYLVRVSNIGFVPQEREVTMAGADIALGTITLAEDSKLLQEVVVTGQRAQMSTEAARKVFNVSSNISSAGASASELLSAIPSVSVSSDGDISLRGNDNVMVWINGKEMGMNADNRAQILRQIPAETIESIEVMTNPSARHSTEGTAGIINIRLKEDHRHGYFGSASADIDSHGSANLNGNITYNEGRFETTVGLGLKTHHTPGGVDSRREYADGSFLNSLGKSRKHENSAFLRLGTNYRPNDNNTIYLSAIGTIGHKWGNTHTIHTSNLPNLWTSADNQMHESGNTHGANILLGYKHEFGHEHHIDINASYNIWQGPNSARTRDIEQWADGSEVTSWHNQHQDVKISNWEAALDYEKEFSEELRLEAGFKGNYNRENSPASYTAGLTATDQTPLNNLYNRFKYDTDINALYFNLSGQHSNITWSAGLRGEQWQIRTRSLGYGQTDAEVPQFKDTRVSLFPSASIGWKFRENNGLKLNYSRRINRPFGPQLNTFENLSDPSEVHLGNPDILPEFSNLVELTYLRKLGAHTLTLAGYFNTSSHMISHISFLAPMAADPNTNTMYYGHANVGNLSNTGLEITSKNIIATNLTLTTTLNLYNSHLRGWTTEYPLHGELYPISGRRQNRFVADARILASLRLPADFTLQASGRYTSRRIQPQGTAEPDWEVEAGVRKAIGPWSLSLICKDIFASKKSHNILYGNGYTQSISKWSEGRTLRLAVSFTFGKTHKHDGHGDHDEHDDHDGHDHKHEQNVNTGGYGDEHHHNH